MSKIKTAIVILNWNGKHWLEKFLPSVLATYGSDYEVIVGDNASTDDSIAFLELHYPTVKIILNDKNYGFAEGYNKILERVDAKYYVLLNSDVEVDSHWLSPMVAHLDSNDNVAACQPKLLDYSQKHKFEYAGAAGGYIDILGYPFCSGRIFDDLEEDNAQFEAIKAIHWASGAAMLVRADLFWKLGGLDLNYFAHMEEIDLCWRLQNIGYEIHYIPTAKVYHVGGGTLNKFSPNKTYLNFRNSLITLVKNDVSSWLFMKVIIRFGLDFIAWLRCFYLLEPKHAWAISKAHIYFIFNALTILKWRKNTLRISKKPINTIYNGSIVWAYYGKGIKLFKDLQF